MADKKDIDSVLNFDGLFEAEKLTGKSYKTDKLTENMGIMFHMINNEERRKKLEQRGDTTLSEKLGSYLEKAKSIGFEIVFKEDFYSKSSKKEESYYILWHPKGILLTFDTFGGRDSLNGGSFYYNWRPHSWKDKYHHLLSSHDAVADVTEPDNEDLWVVSGNHDCREALIHKVSNLMENGEFLNPWMRKQNLWLVHHGEKPEESYNFEYYDKKTEEKIRKLPEHIKKCIIGEEY